MESLARCFICRSMCPLGMALIGKNGWSNEQRKEERSMSAEREGIEEI
jgi:hypothetical protein